MIDLPPGWKLIRILHPSSVRCRACDSTDSARSRSKTGMFLYARCLACGITSKHPPIGIEVEDGARRHRILDPERVKWVDPLADPNAVH